MLPASPKETETAEPKMLIYFVVVPVSTPSHGHGPAPGSAPGGWLGRDRGVLVRWVAVNGCGAAAFARRPGPTPTATATANARPFRGPGPGVRRLRTSTLHARGLRSGWPARASALTPAKRPPLHLGIYLLLGRGSATPAIAGPVKNDQRPEAVTTPPFNTAIPPLAIETSSNPLAVAKSASQPLEVTASNEQTANWLQSRRFGAYLNTFTNFSANDLLRLTRDDLIQICGMADGIRLFNALHSKRAAPRLTVYVNMGGQSDIFHALYLDQLKSIEVAQGLASLLGVTVDQIGQVLLQGPGGIRVVVTDDVVQVMKNEAAFNVNRLPDASGERSCLLMTPISM